MAASQELWGDNQKEPGCSPWWDNRQRMKPEKFKLKRRNFLIRTSAQQGTKRFILGAVLSLVVFKIR